MGTPIEWSLLYAAAGWRSFPVNPGRKDPVYKGWQKDATTDEALIRQYWNGSAGAERNTGLVCGEAFEAIDIEKAHVGRFQDWLGRNGYILPEAPLAQTGGGGIHLLVRPFVGHTRYLYLDGIHVGELKGDGGYILACPSETTDSYRWLHLPDGLRLPKAPDWFGDLLERPQKPAGYLPKRLATPADYMDALKRLVGSVRHAGEGRRNSYLYWAMRRAIEEGIEPLDAHKALAEAAHEAGLDEHEIEQTIGSALTAEQVAA